MYNFAKRKTFEECLRENSPLIYTFLLSLQKTGCGSDKFASELAFASRLSLSLSNVRRREREPVKK